MEICESEQSNRRESQNWKRNEWLGGPFSTESLESMQESLHHDSRPLPPPEIFVRRRKVNSKPPPGPSEEYIKSHFETTDLSYSNVELDDPYDGLLEALMV